MSTITQRLSVAEYDRMVADGRIAEDDPVELIQGRLIEKMPRNPPHRVATRKTAKALERLVPPGWYVQVQEAIVCPDSRPEPDVAVVQAEMEYDATRDPLGWECYLVVEVADTSLIFDRTAKRDLYASGGIPIYWIVNLVSRRLEVYAHPVAGVYSAAISLSDTDTVDVVIDGQVVGTIAVADLLSLGKEEARP